MKKIFAILAVIATVTAAVFAGSDNQSKEFKMKTAEQAADSELILENWMLSPLFESTDVEAKIDLEDWMIEFESKDVEAKIDLENWMIETDSFADENVELEEWMLEDSNSTRTAGQDQVLENWMFIYS
ncbi:MAG: hypothetical protein ISS19_12825 [Bacteroidales bacterium]|nr:hypothetical protein [Bacteroidales bacterium]